MAWVFAPKGQLIVLLVKSHSQDTGPGLPDDSKEKRTVGYLAANCPKDTAHGCGGLCRIALHTLNAACDVG